MTDAFFFNHTLLVLGNSPESWLWSFFFSGSSPSPLSSLKWKDNSPNCSFTVWKVQWSIIRDFINQSLLHRFSCFQRSSRRLKSAVDIVSNFSNKTEMGFQKMNKKIHIVQQMAALKRKKGQDYKWRWNPMENNVQTATSPLGVNSFIIIHPWESACNRNQPATG